MFIQGDKINPEIFDSHFSTLWYVINFILYGFLYFSFMYFSNDILNQILFLLLTSLLLGIGQGLLIKKYISIFKYWIIIVPSGVIVGILWMVCFSITMIIATITISYISMDILNFATLSVILIPVAISFMFLLYFYIVWTKVLLKVFSIYHFNL